MRVRVSGSELQSCFVGLDGLCDTPGFIQHITQIEMRQRREGLTEALFGELNEQIRNLTDDLGTDGGTITVILRVVQKIGVASEVAEETNPRS